MTAFRKSLSALVALAALALPAAARADWGWTRWGMSVEEVVAGSGGRIARVAGTPGSRVHGWDRLAEGRIDYDGVAVTAQFYFDPAGQALRVVRLRVIDYRDCVRLRAAVIARLGEPDQATGPAEWRGDGHGDFVGMASHAPSGDYPGICFVRFRPASEEPAD